MAKQTISSESVMEYILNKGKAEAPVESPKVESTADAILESIPAGWDPANYSKEAGAVRIEQLKRETELKRAKALGHPAIRKSEVQEPAPPNETEEHNLIRRMAEVIKVKTQLGLINPDQCLGCTHLHKFGVKVAISCACVCHQARAYLQKHKVAQAA